jgi:DNA polymerase-1
MTASAGLHNLPAELRPAVRAEPGHVLVRADLGQVEPRVLAGLRDEALAAAARENDLYAPVAAQLRCDRPTAKVAVLAAMYGQTSGAAGAALRDMDRTYPRAMAYLRDAEEAGRARPGHKDVRRAAAPAGARGRRRGRRRDGGGEHAQVTAGHGRFARNAVIQGAAAELFKAWAATVRSGLGVLDGEIVMCLHDELVVHVPAEHTDAARSCCSTPLPPPPAGGPRQPGPVRRRGRERRELGRRPLTATGRPAEVLPAATRRSRAQLICGGFDLDSRSAQDHPHHRSPSC